MTDDMVMFSNGEITFMYRVGGIAVNEGRLLVEHNVKHGFCFVPGGRVEYGENAVQALSRELDEEFGGGVQVGRLVIVADNLFELDGVRYQEACLYFLMEFDLGHHIIGREGKFEAEEPNLVYQWLPLDELVEAELFPRFLRELVLDIPQTPKYVIQSHIDSCWTESYPNVTGT